MPILDDFAKAIAQVFDPAFWGVLIKALALTITILFLAGTILIFLIGLVMPATLALPIIGTISLSPALLSLASIPFILITSMFLMFPLAAILVSVFLDPVASAVERKHYPYLSPAVPIPFSQALAEGVRFGMSFLIYNMIAVIIYFLIPFLAPMIFLTVNGYLIGREYFTQVARRRMGRDEADAFRRKFRWRAWLAGMLFAVPLSIPGINLIMPVLGIATFTHQVARLSGGLSRQ